MKYKLAALDCDNTLLDEYGNICDINKEVISKLRDMGMEFVIATGRNDILAKDYAEELDLHVPIISCNGAMISNLFTDEVFLIDPIPRPAVYRIFNCLNSRGILFKILTDKACYTNDRKSMEQGLGQIVKKYTRVLKYGIPYNFVEDMDTIRDMENILKIVVIEDDPERRGRIQAELKKTSGVNVHSAGFNCIDTISVTASKGGALKLYAEKRGIDRSEIIAFGDGDNDRSMIEYAGIGAAMINGDESLKKAADIITKHNNTDGGVGYTLAEIFGLEL